MKTVVQMEIEVPEGYELAEPLMRKPVAGEWFLTTGGVLHQAECELMLKYPILKEKWVPEVGKWYMFSNNISKIYMFSHEE